jgi:transglutaminase-like putative cysteine protease
MTPLTVGRQNKLDARVETTPAAPMWQYWDYWGTRVSTFDLQKPHRQLTVRAASVVETADQLPLAAPPSWDEIADHRDRTRLAEYSSVTPRTLLDASLIGEARDLVAGADAHEAAAAIFARVSDRLEYVPGATGVQTRAQEAWDQGSGVCQDIAHVAVGLLRAVGLPARYVSGYLHPDIDPEPQHSAIGQSHAWAEYWAGDWVGFDPTNRIPAGPRHVLVARGRDYGDVVPHHGIYHGAPSSTLAVVVELTRLA